jgi:hypothetical protein
MFIAITQYCTVHNVDITFVQTLAAEGLINLTDGDEITEEQLPDLELYTRWHSEMGINPEGMDVIRHLLQRIRGMQTEMEALKTRLHLYE